MTQQDFNDIINTTPNLKRMNSDLLGSKLGLTFEEVKELRRNHVFPLTTTVEPVVHYGGTDIVSSTKTQDEQIHTITTNRTLTEEQLLLEFKIDKSVWDLKQIYHKSTPSGSISYTLNTIRKKNVNSVDILKITERFISPKIEQIIPYVDELEDLMFVLFLTDYHLAKKTMNVLETLHSKKEYYIKAVSKSIRRILDVNGNITEINYIIGSDFFNQDNLLGTTTKGTPQDNIASVTEEFEAGLSLMIETITMLKQICTKLNITVINGNHDTLTSFYLGHTLNAYFKNENITFDIEFKNRKVITFGETAILFEHGDIKDLKKLIPVFAQEFSKEYCNCKFKEVHTGDKHFLKMEELGVRLIQYPTLNVGTDRWHDKKLYINNIPSALIPYYNLSEGHLGQLEVRM